MVKRKLKRFAAPSFWPLKKAKFVAKPSAGPHPIHRSIPLLIILRDMLGYVNNLREAKIVLNEGKVLVDGVVRRSYRYPVGVMDVITIPAMKERYRTLPDRKNRLFLHPIPKKEANQKLCRIEGKTTVEGGHIQLNLHDGRNYLVKIKDPQNPQEDTYSTGASLLLKVPKQKLKEHLAFNKNNLALVAEGKQAGRVGKINEIERVKGPQHNLVTLEDDEGEFQTIQDYVFVVGKRKPRISLPEEK